jgi:hypothetical protein
MYHLVADAYAHVQRLIFSSQNGGIAWGVYYRIAAFCYAVFTVGSICREKRFTTGCKYFAHDDEVELEVCKWLRQQSKHFYAAGFHALVNIWDKCISVGGGYVEKYFFRFEYRVFYVLYPFVTYLLTLSRISGGPIEVLSPRKPGRNVIAVLTKVRTRHLSNASLKRSMLSRFALLCCVSM